MPLGRAATQLGGALGHLHTVVRGEHQHAGSRLAGHQILQHFQSIHLGHFEIQQHQVNRLGVELLERVFAICGEHQLVVLLQYQLNRGADNLLVIANQDRVFGHRYTPTGLVTMMHSAVASPTFVS